MPLFAMMAYDHPNAFALREELRPAHRAYVAANIAPLRLAGALTNDAQQQIGSLLVFEADDIEAVRAWMRAEPFNRDGLYERIDIQPWGLAYGQISDSPRPA